ncbi:MAG: MBL fold metallo-hydrolase [Clostridia bacterium]|nr:MBL fold metallo-hydrolase [Clostridia bacterium]
MRRIQSTVKRKLRRAVRGKQTGKILLFAVILILIYFYTQQHPSVSGDIFSKEDTFSEPAMAVHFIDVGQGDAAYVELPTGETILIDAGPNSSENQLLAYLDTCNADVIDYAVFTHPHEDHIGGADKVLQKYKVKNVLLPSADSTTTTYERMLDAILESGATTLFAQVGDRYTLGEATFTILGPATDTYDNLNDASIVLRLDYKDISFLFTGDAEKSSEKAIIEAVGTKALDADVLKSGHHGSSTSSGKVFLDAVTPSVAVISCGVNNDYGHPHTETMTEYQARDMKIFRTDQLGSIRIYTDGTTLLVHSDHESE